MALPTASDNVWPKLILSEGAAPAAPPAGQVKLYAKADGLLYWKDDAGTEYPMGGAAATWADLDQDHDAHDHTGVPGVGAGGASLPDQSIVYPTSFSGNDEDGTSVANWADVAAYTSKSVADGKFAYFMRGGGAGISRVRKTLPTPRAGALDFRFGLAVNGSFWSSAGDTYWLIELRTAADALIAVVRIEHYASGTILYYNNVRVGGSGGPVANGSIINRNVRHGERATYRITRDGSDVVRFYVDVGGIPMVSSPIMSGGIVPYTVASAGTVERIEIACNTINVANSELWLDYFDDAS